MTPKVSGYVIFPHLFPRPRKPADNSIRYTEAQRSLASSAKEHREVLTAKENSELDLKLLMEQGFQALSLKDLQTRISSIMGSMSKEQEAQTNLQTLLTYIENNKNINDFIQIIADPKTPIGVQKICKHLASQYKQKAEIQKLLGVAREREATLSELLLKNEPTSRLAIAKEKGIRLLELSKEEMIETNNRILNEQRRMLGKLFFGGKRGTDIIKTAEEIALATIQRSLNGVYELNLNGIIYTITEKNNNILINNKNNPFVLRDFLTDILLRNIHSAHNNGATEYKCVYSEKKPDDTLKIKIEELAERFSIPVLQDIYRLAVHTVVSGDRWSFYNLGLYGGLTPVPVYGNLPEFRNVHTREREYKEGRLRLIEPGYVAEKREARETESHSLKGVAQSIVKLPAKPIVKSSIEELSRYKNYVEWTDPEFQKILEEAGVPKEISSFEELEGLLQEVLPQDNTLKQVLEQPQKEEIETDLVQIEGTERIIRRTNREVLKNIEEFITNPPQEESVRVETFSKLLSELNMIIESPSKEDLKEALSARGTLYLVFCMYTEAESDYRERLTIEKGHKSTLYNLAVLVCVSEGNTDKTKEYLEQIWNQPGGKDFFVSEWQRLQSAGDKVNTTFVRILSNFFQEKRFSPNSEIYNLTAKSIQATLSNMNPNEAFGKFCGMEIIQIRRTQSKNEPPEVECIIPQELKEESQLLISIRKFLNTMIKSKKLGKEEHMQALFMRIFLSKKYEDRAKVIADYKQILELTEDKDIRFNVLRSLAKEIFESREQKNKRRQTEALREARRYYLEAKELYSNSLDIFVNLAIIHLNLNEKNEALKYIKELHMKELLATIKAMINVNVYTEAALDIDNINTLIRSVRQIIEHVDKNEVFKHFDSEKFINYQFLKLLLEEYDNRILLTKGN